MSPRRHEIARGIDRRGNDAVASADGEAQKTLAEVRHSMPSDAEPTRDLDTSVFPLPLVPFERYMRADDRPWLPMAFTIRLVFSGKLRPDVFRRALRLSVDREPLLRANIRGTTPRDSQWIAAPDAPPFCDIGPLDAPMEFPDKAQIDITRATGLRTWVRHDDQRAEMRFQFHHSCCDGIGAYRFLDDLLRIYDRLARPDSTVSPSIVDVSLLPARANLGMGRLHRMLKSPYHWIGTFIGGLIYYFRGPKVFASPERPTIDDAALRRLPEYPVRRISAETLRGISAAAKSAGVSLNDLLTADLFLSLRDWQVQTRGEPHRGRLRVMVPVNARTPSDERMPATNIVGMIPVSCSAHLFNRPGRVQRRVNRFLRMMRALGGVTLFLRGLRMFEMFGGFRIVLSDKYVGGTACLSNVGRVFSNSTLPRRGDKLMTGDLCLEAVESTPPIRPLTPISITVLTYAGSMTLGLNYDRQTLTAAAAEAFLDMYVERLRQHAETR